MRSLLGKPEAACCMDLRWRVAAPRRHGGLIYAAVIHHMQASVDDVALTFTLSSHCFAAVYRCGDWSLVAFAPQSSVERSSS
ncbi:hypothetical protein ABZP36_016589 [Zizania latifolia]